jgi:hypothetical protein
MVKYTSPQWRCFDRCILGLKKYKKLGIPVRFLTLTLPQCNCVYKPAQMSLDGSLNTVSGELEHDNEGKKRLVQILWRLLYKRIEHEYGPIPYFAVRTSESNGVLHVVLAGPYIPFAWIMEQWTEIAGTVYIWICDPYHRRGFRMRKPADVAHYLMAQYVGFKQPDFTFGWSHNWVYPGFARDYAKLRSTCRNTSVPPIFEGYGNVVFPIDIEWLNREWEALMEKKVYHPDKGSKDAYTIVDFSNDYKALHKSLFGYA